MDKKKLHKANVPDDLKGFEEFLEHAEPSAPTATVDSNPGKNVGGENYTFLEHDNIRLRKVAELMAAKLPTMKTKSQGERLIEEQRKRNAQLKLELFQLLSAPDSPLEKSLAAIFNPVFKDAKIP